MSHLRGDTLLHSALEGMGGLLDSSSRMLNDNTLIEQHSFTRVEMDSLMYCAITVSALSSTGSCLVIWSYFYFQKLQKFAFKLVVMLAVSDLGSGIGYFIGSPPNGVLCTFQAMLLHYFQISSFLWTTVIAFVLERTVCRQQGLAIQEKRMYLHLYAWGVPLVLVLLPFTTAHLMPHGLAYSNTFEEWSDKDYGAWCWIGADDKGIGTMWRFLTFYVPLWLAMGYNLWSYNKVITTLKITLRNQNGGEETPEHRQKMKIVRRLRWYPALLLVCWLPGTVNRIHNAAAPGSPVFWLYILHATFSSAQGLGNSMVYGLNKGVQAAWREKFPASAACLDRLCCCCCRCAACAWCGGGAGYTAQTDTNVQVKKANADGKMSI